MKKILVVDDDEDILSVVKYILISQGFDVQTHSTGLDVPDIVLHYDPNLILLDIRLPGKSGTEVCKDLKKMHAVLPIILFSAHADYRQSYDTCHADGFIQKPFEIKNLIEIIRLNVN